VKILLLSHIFPPAIDGGSRVIWKIGEYLQKEGHQVKALTTNCFSTDDFVTPTSIIIPKSPKTNSVNHIPMTRLPVYKRLRKPLKALKILFPKNSKVFNFLSLLQKGPIYKLLPLRKALLKIQDFKPDLIIAGPLPTTIILYAKLIKRICHCQLLISPCFHPKDPDFQNPLLFPLLNQADYLFTFTKFEKDQLQKHLVNKPKIFVSPLGVDPNFILDPKKVTYPKNPNILFIANFSAHKRTELLIKAFQKLLLKHPHLTLTLLGQKTLYWPQIQKKLDKLPKNTCSKIKIFFSPSHSQIKKSIDSSTLLCLPSIHESFGLVLVESLARGKTVLTTDTPQTQEVATLLSAHTFKTDNLNDLVNKLDTLLSTPSKLKSSAQKGQATVINSLTWDRIVHQLLISINEK